MKPIEEIKAIPKIKLYMPKDDRGVARFKLSSTKHNQLTRVVFSCHSGFDVVQIMFKRKKRVTLEEVEEIKQLFFKESEIPQCETALHPDNDLIVMVYRQQEVADGN